MRHKKTIAATLALTMLLPVFSLCGCKSKTAKTKIYSADTPWYKADYSDIVAHEGSQSDMIYAGRSNGNYEAGIYISVKTENCRWISLEICG